MKWESKVVNEMLSCLCVLKNTPSWMAPLVVLLLLFSSYQLVGIFGLLSALSTILAVLISTLVYIWKHNNQVPADHKLVVEETASSSEEENSNKTENVELVPTPMSTSENTGEDDHNPEFSDGSISDEESLIEIAIPSGHLLFVGQQHKEEPRYNNNCSLQQKKKKQRELVAESLYKRQSLMMELLAEFNDMIEEENLIEIDISMGVIKYSGFEIEA